MVEAIASFGRDDRPDAVRLVVVGDLDDSNREDWYAALARLITDATGSAVVDLTGVTFFGSAGIGSLVAGTTGRTCAGYTSSSGRRGWCSAFSRSPA